MSDSCLVKQRGHVLRGVASLFLLPVLLLWSSARPASAAPVETRQLTAELIAADSALVPGQHTWIGLRLQHKPTWHTYWTNPGDAGFATSLEWDLPEGFTVGELLFPYPHLFEGQGGLAGYGYEGETVLLALVTPPAKLVPGGGFVTLKAKASWLACDPSVCVPGSADLELMLPVAEKATPGPGKKLIDEFLAQQPRRQSGWSADAEDSGETFRLRISHPPGAKVDTEGLYFFPIKKNTIAPGAPQEFHTVAEGIIEASLRKARSDAELPASIAGVLYSPSDFGPNTGKAILFATGAGPAVHPEVNPTGAAPINRFTAILFALLGGLILNLMPCVFPVISLKIMSFVNQAGEDRRSVMRHGLVFTLGVLFSFWSLSGLLIALRSAGAEVGWGFQLQEPAFIMAMSALLFLLSLSLFGVFEIGAGITGIGGSLSTKSGYAGSFWSGALATVLATPCAAPFMGPAVGYALAQPPVASLVVFTALGVGMSLPYLLLSFFPQLMKYIPKPGAWMETFKQAMGFPMLAVVIWLLWVLGQQVDINGLALHLGTLFTLGLAAWVLGRFGKPGSGKPRRLATMAVAAVIALTGFWASKKAIALADSQDNSDWIPWSEAAVVEELDAGHPVFIDFTAAWCLTCQANKLALHSSKVLDKVAEKKIALLEADWTDNDPAITKALARHDRAGVPLYVLIDPNARDRPVILPQLLTPGILLEAFEKLP